MRYTPAKKWVGYTALLVCLFLPLLFAALLRHEVRSPKPLDAAQYEAGTPTGFVSDFTVETDGGALVVDGWACVEGERILTVDNHVVLYNRDTGEYLQLPTVAVSNEAATEAVGGDIQYSRAGFVSITPLKLLPAAPESYELCFAYRSHGFNALVHTGQTLAGGAA